MVATEAIAAVVAVMAPMKVIVTHQRARPMDRQRRLRARPANRTVTRSDPMLNLKVVSWSLATTALVSYLVCVSYGIATPESLHMHAFLEQVLPGFTWLTGWGFVAGLVESFLYGAYAGMVYVPIYNFFQRRWGAGS